MGVEEEGYRLHGLHEQIRGDDDDDDVRKYIVDGVAHK